MRCLVTGAAGMIGGFMVADLLAEGHTVTAVDKKPLYEWQQLHSGAFNIRADLNDLSVCLTVCNNQEQVYDFAADMGGIGFIETFRAECAFSIVMTANMLRAARARGVDRFFKSSSACVYRADLQDDPDVVALTESDAWPAMPERGYGLEKLYGEELCMLSSEDYGLTTRIARYHNIYSGGPTTWTGGREKAPAAICRKVAEAVYTGRHQIDIWGDGEQTRSFCWIDDCLEGSKLLMASDYGSPLNIGSDELVTINQLVTIAEDIAGITLDRTYDLTAPQGVRGRNSDNTLCENVLGWAPSTPLHVGMEKLYLWVESQVAAG